MVRRFADVAFARQEDERVGVRRKRAQGGRDVARKVDVLGVLGGEVADLDREEASRDDQRGRVVEELREALRVKRRGRHDDLEVAPPREEALEDPEEKVDVEGAFVSLVDDDRVVSAQKGI